MKIALSSLTATLVAVTLLFPTNISAIRGDVKEEEKERQIHHGCYSGIAEIQRALESKPKRIVVCPDTVLNLEIDNSIRTTFISLRSDTEFLCGEEGSSKNRCILQGSNTTSWGSGSRELNNKIQIRGFTFREQTVFATKGDFSFQDCVFEDSALHFVTNNLDLSEDDTNPPELLVKDCLFQNFRKKESTSLVTIFGNRGEITIENCVFQNNMVDQYGIFLATKGAQVHLQNNCFIDNHADADEENCSGFWLNLGYGQDGNDECISNQVEPCSIDWYNANSLVEEEATEEERDLENNH